jgi:glucose-6-phosphate 1-epimerase
LAKDQVSTLDEQFAVPGVLHFGETLSGLVFAQVTAPAAEATIYLHGAHLTHWQPKGTAPVIFLSDRTELAPGKAIRGGIPIIFPWFGTRHDGGKGPSHGFARTSEWELAFAAVAGDEVHLTFTLAPNEASRALGFDHFRLAYRMVIGPKLNLELTVANDSGSGGGRMEAPETAAEIGAPLVFEEALHTYYAVSDVRQTTVTGLGGTTYIDKRDEFKRKLQPEGPLTLTGTTDRVYLDTTATCVINDPKGKRTITIEKSGSQSTVVWNPWAQVAATLADMDPESWPGMLCVETANVDDSTVTLAPGKTHTMRMVVSVENEK